MAEPVLQEAPQEAPQPPQEAPKAETPTVPHTPETLAQNEQRRAEEGMTKLNEMGKGFRSEAEVAAQNFKQETKSLWSRVKDRFFKKKEPTAAGEAAVPTAAETPVKGEDEILKEVEKADAVYAAFKAKYDDIMASGDQAGLKSLENSLSKAYDELAPQVADEGAKDAKAMKQALKTGVMAGEPSAIGAKLNDVTNKLFDVRARMNGATPEQIAAMRAPKPEAGAAAEAPAEQVPAEAPAPQTPQAEAPKEAPMSPEDLKAKSIMELRAGAKGTPGEQMVDEYLSLKDKPSDSFGEISGLRFTPAKGEIRVSYADGSSVYRFASGLILRSVPNVAKPERLAPADFTTPRKKPQAEIVEDAEDEISTEGVVSGETESREPGAEPEQEPSVVVDQEALLSDAERLERFEQTVERARAHAEKFLNELYPGFTVKTRELTMIDDEGGIETLPLLEIRNPNLREMNTSLAIGSEQEADEGEIEGILLKKYDDVIEKIGMTPEQLKNLEETRGAVEDKLKSLDAEITVTTGNTAVHKGGNDRPDYEVRILEIRHPSNDLLNFGLEYDLNDPEAMKAALKAAEALYVRKTEHADEERERLKDLPPGWVAHEIVSEDTVTRKGAPESAPEAAQPEASTEAQPAAASTEAAPAAPEATVSEPAPEEPPAAPEAPAAEPETAPAAAPEAPKNEKKERGEDKVEAGMAKVAAAMIASTDSPKTLASKVTKMKPDEFLTMFNQSGAITDAEQGALLLKFKFDQPLLDELRKKLAAAVKKVLKDAKG